jgi:outer membrane protein TolC
MLDMNFAHTGGWNGNDLHPFRCRLLLLSAARSWLRDNYKKGFRWQHLFRFSAPSPLRHLLYAVTLGVSLGGARLLAQVTSQSTGSTTITPATQVPLSGRSVSPGSVSTTQVVTATGASSVDVSSSSVSVSGQYSGSVPASSAVLTNYALTLDDAIKLGLRNNLGSITEANSVLQARGLRLVSRSNLLPNASSSLGESLEKINLAAQGLRSPMIPGVVTFNVLDGRVVKLNQSILDFVAIKNLHSATQSLHAAQDSARDARDLVVLAVAGSYLQIVTTQARVVAVRALVESERAVYQQSSDQLQAGVAVLVDVTRTQVQYQTDLQLLRSETADVEKQKLNLGRIIGLPLGSSFVVVDEFPYVPLTDLTVEASLQRAIAARADLQAARSGVKAAESALGAARAEYLPNATFTGDWGFIGTNPSQVISTYTITGSVNVPIFQGGRVQGDTAQARAALNQRKAELEDTLGAIDHDVRTAFIDLDSAADQVGVAESNVSLSHQTLKQSRDRFAAGITTSVEVVQSEQAVAQADADYISAVYQHNLAKITLSRAMGQTESNLRQLLKVSR